MGFDSAVVIGLVRDFYRTHRVEAGTQFIVAANLADGLRTAALKGADGRWSSIALVATALDSQRPTGQHHAPRNIHDIVYRHVLAQPVGGAWAEFRGVVVSAADADALPGSLREACERGLGWLLLADRTAVIVPSPVVRVVEGRPDLLHDDSGRMAVVWPDGSGGYFLHGSEFDKRRYFQVINHELLIQDIAALDNADQRAIALQYLTLEQLVLDSDAELLDQGVRGTSLFRLPLPPRIARDRKVGYGTYDYFIHMRDASHPEREFIEWVDPDIGKLRNAELCQARAFGISLSEWLSIEQEG